MSDQTEASATEPRTLNRLSLGATARLGMFMTNHRETLMNKGYAHAAGVCNAAMEFKVTEQNVRALCESPEMPHLAVIQPQTFDLTPPTSRAGEKPALEPRTRTIWRAP